MKLSVFESRIVDMAETGLEKDGKLGRSQLSSMLSNASVHNP